MTITEIKNAIQKLERNELVDVRTFINRIASSASGLRHGMQVKFTHSKTGAEIQGTVVKINRKSVKVDTKQDEYGRDLGYKMTWTCSPGLLKIVE